MLSYFGLIFENFPNSANLYRFWQKHLNCLFISIKKKTKVIC